MESDWEEQGRCRGLDPDTMFVDGAAQTSAKAFCTGCPVRIQCLSFALDHRIEYGIWGGETSRDRRRLLQRRPGVQNWGTFLEAAQLEYGQQPNAAAA